MWDRLKRIHPIWWLAAFLVLINVLWIGPTFLGHGSLRQGDEAPGFALPRVDDTGEIVSLESLRGSVVLLVFWATWCDSCIAEIPVVGKVARAYGDRGLAVVGMNVAQGSGADVARFLKARGVAYPNVTVDGSTAAQYEVSLLPAIYVVDAGGKVCKAFTGRVGPRRLASAVEKCMGAR